MDEINLMAQTQTPRDTTWEQISTATYGNPPSNGRLRLSSSAETGRRDNTLQPGPYRAQGNNASASFINAAPSRRMNLVFASIKKLFGYLLTC